MCSKFIFNMSTRKKCTHVEIVTMKRLLWGLLLYTNALCMKGSNMIASNVTIGFLRRVALQNIKGQYNILADFVTVRQLPREILLDIQGIFMRA